MRIRFYPFQKEACVKQAHDPDPRPLWESKGHAQLGIWRSVCTIGFLKFVDFLFDLILYIPSTIFQLKNMLITPQTPVCLNKLKTLW